MRTYRVHSVISFFVIICGLLVAPLHPLMAQEKETQYSQNAIFAEGLGPGIFYSINYDHRFTPNMSIRVGFTSWSLPGLFLIGETNVTAFPITVNHLIGKGASHLELGIGIMPTIVSFSGQEIFFGTQVSGSSTVVLGTANIGYRLQPNEGGIFFRIGFTPLFTFQKFQPWGGVSLGASF
jgi:hypothetical protein